MPLASVWTAAQAQTITSIEPSAGFQGVPVTVTIKGAGFVASDAIQTTLLGWSSPPMGLGGAVRVVDAQTATVDLMPNVPPGKYYVGVVSTPRGAPSTSAASNMLPFTVLPSAMDPSFFLKFSVNSVDLMCGAAGRPRRTL